MTPIRLHHHLLLERIAVGGMATVWLAVDARPGALRRPVVVKQLREELVEQGAAGDLLAEAQLACRIEHPNVVSILDVDTAEDLPYIVMTYVRGVSLRELERAAARAGRTIDVGAAVGLVAQAAAGAHAAHELRDDAGRPYGLVHRDLTPHNLMVTADGHLVVLDFGIAKATRGPDRTRAGVLKGKAAYMAPEQLWERPIDRRVDVYALGVVLYELLAGRHPFRRGTEVATMQAVLHDPVPALPDLRPDIPPALGLAVEAAMSRDPAERPPTCEAFRRRILAAAREGGLEPSEDTVAAEVERLVGPALAERLAEVDRLVGEALGSMAPSPRSDEPPPAPEASPLQVAGGSGTGTFSTAVRNPWVSAIVAGSAAVLLLALGVLWWALGHRATAPGPGSEVLAPAAVEGEPVTIALAPIMDSRKLQNEMEPVRRWLEHELQRPVAWRTPASYDETAGLLLAGRVDFARIPPFLYARTSARHPEVHPLVTLVHDGSDGTDAVILVRTDRSIERVEDLRHRRICFTDPSSTTGYRLPRRWLADHGLDVEDDLRVRFSGTHTQVLRDLAADLCDAGATYLDVFARASSFQVSIARMRVFQVVGRTPNDAICAGPHTDPALTRAVREALLAFDPRAVTGRATAGPIEHLTGFAPAAPDRYAALRDLLVDAGAP